MMKDKYNVMQKERYQELVDKDYPPFEVTDKTRQECIRKGVRGDVRASLGMFCIDEEWEQIRKKVLETPLP